MSLLLRGAPVVLALMACLASPPPAQAQTVDSLRAHYRLAVPDPMAANRSAPAMGVNTPIAFGARWGDVYGGAAFAARARYIEQVDGSVAVGVGLGNPATLVGLEVNVTSFSTLRSGWGNNMAVDVKAHRMLPGRFAIAAGWEGALVRGEIDGGRSRYVVVSRWIPLKPSDPGSRMALLASAGVGDGRFRLWDDWVEDADRLGVFGSVAFRFSGPASVIVDWTGQDAIAGLSIAPIPRLPLLVTVGAADFLGIAGDGVRLVLAGGLALRFD